MILLELTEKEAELLAKVIVAKEEDVNCSNAGFSEKERVTKLCGSIVKKVLDAQQTQKDTYITSKDLFHIISLAKSEYPKLVGDLHLSNKKVEECDFKHISLATAVILWLNGNKLLKRLVRFDFTDNSCQYEEIE
jgi:hypothetical protein